MLMCPGLSKGYIEHLPSGSFRVSVYVGTDPLTRRAIRLKATAKTEQQARIELGRLLKEANQRVAGLGDATLDPGHVQARQPGRRRYRLRRCNRNDAGGEPAGLNSSASSSVTLAVRSARREHPRGGLGQVRGGHEHRGEQPQDLAVGLAQD